MPPRPASLKVRALQWLAQREHSRDELRSKLLHLLRADRRSQAEDAASADPATEVDALLAWLEAHGYLSQARFIESRVHARQSRFGNLRIRQELQQHGVVLDAETQQALQQSEFDRALDVWRRRYAGPAADAAARLRQVRFLVGRGFSLDVVRRVVKVADGTVAGASDGD